MSLKDFYDYHIQLLAEGDVDKLVEHDYHVDAEMILLVQQDPIYIKGQTQLKEQLGAYMKYVYRGFTSTDKFAQTDDSLFFEATIETANGPSKVFDALYFKDGKIFRHYSGLKG